MAVPQGISIVLYAVTRRQRFASFLSMNQLLFLSLYLFSQLLFVYVGVGEVLEGGWLGKPAA